MSGGWCSLRLHAFTRASSRTCSAVASPSLPPCVPVCRCGRPLDSFGHHRAACPRAGLFVRRGFAVEMAAAKVCREAGARVTTNVMVRDLDLGVPQPAFLDVEFSDQRVQAPMGGGPRAFFFPFSRHYWCFEALGP